MSQTHPAGLFLLQRDSCHASVTELRHTGNNTLCYFIKIKLSFIPLCQGGTNVFFLAVEGGTLPPGSVQEFRSLTCVRNGCVCRGKGGEGKGLTPQYIRTLVGAPCPSLRGCATALPTLAALGLGLGHFYPDAHTAQPCYPRSPSLGGTATPGHGVLPKPPLSSVLNPQSNPLKLLKMLEIKQESRVTAGEENQDQTADDYLQISSSPSKLWAGRWGRGQGVLCPWSNLHDAAKAKKTWFRQ